MRPPIAVRETLEAARRAGVPFADAWPAALDAVGDEGWRSALAQTAATWRRAYALEPPLDADFAIDLLSRGIANELADLNAADRCPVCDGVVAQYAKSDRVYCSLACQRIAKRSRRTTRRLMGDVQVRSVKWARAASRRPVGGRPPRWSSIARIRSAWSGAPTAGASAATATNRAAAANAVRGRARGPRLPE